jgi:hypothetical protein
MQGKWRELGKGRRYRAYLREGLLYLCVRHAVTRACEELRERGGAERERRGKEDVR